MDDLSDVISNLATGVYEVVRPNPAGYDSTTGLAEPDGAPTEFDIVACVQPASGKELQRLTEGRRSKTVWSVWTATALELEDVINIGGAECEVEHVADWTAAGNFCKALAVRKD